jgi:hypothetical protein
MSLALSLLLAAQSPFSTGDWVSQCESQNPNQIWDSQVWIVDDLMTPPTTVGTVPLTPANIATALDAALQQLQRTTRARTRNRVELGQCTGGSNLCISSTTSSAAGCPPGVIAVATKMVGNVHIYICNNNAALPGNAWEYAHTVAGSSNLVEILLHEIMHGYGAFHPDDGTCITGVCGTSTDGANGELMAASPGCPNSHHFPAAGDRQVVRQRNGGNNSWSRRRVMIGSASNATTQPTLANTPCVTWYAPRIACANSTAISADGYDCVLLTTTQVAGSTRPEMRLTGLRSFNSATGTFAIQTFLTAISLPEPLGAGLGLPLQPDIALNSFGTESDVVFTRDEFGQELWVVRYNTATGATTIFPIDDDVVLAPRISSAGRGGAAFSRQPLIVAQRANGSAFGSDWAFYRYSSTGVVTVLAPATNQPLITTNLTAAATNHRGAPVADYDVDCTIASCTLVSVNYRPNQTTNLTAVQALEFVHPSGAANNAVYSVTSGWGQRSLASNAVIGVARQPSSGEMLISNSRPTSLTSTVNTRTFRHAGPNFTTAGIDDGVLLSDAESCSGSPALTTHGGYDVAWCPNCNRYISAHMGRRSDGNDFCF